MRKVLFIGNDERLRREYLLNEPDCDFVMEKLEHAVNRMLAYDVLILSDLEVQPKDLSRIVEDMPAGQTFYLISNSYKPSIIDNKISICRQNQIIPIHPKLTIAQIVQYLMGLAPEEHAAARRAIAIMGSHAQIGTTMITLSLAAKLAETMSVAVLGLNSFNPGNTFMDYNGLSLDELYNQIAGNTNLLQSDEIVSFMHRHPSGFYYLCGNQDFTKRNHFRSDHIDQLVELFRQSFDCVLLDIGCSPDTNLAIQGLLNAGTKILLTTQQPTAHRIWQRMNTDILRYLNVVPEEFLLVVNKYKSDLPLNSRSIEHNMGIPLLETIPDFTIEGEICEIEGKLLIESKDRVVKRQSEEAVSRIASSIRQHIGMESPASGGERRRSALWRKLVRA